ncbi:Slp family lipoprotein [Nitrospira lenta]|uniref:Putative Outer membrane lipoprotein Slp n=1 Tax=Nitrospira lenta TaxID=1436998 RepID=A0A330L3B7_9BACT|nr:Slp family lipoprotein [Nitrospira lenta]SPP63713.1 putative Outer membrane lipoprotein Slp [Nitrospira lenta]
MQRLSIFLFSALFLGAAGCATSQESGDSAQPPPLAFAQVKAAPDSYKNQTVIWGGEVLSARRLKEGTRIEILQLPLNSSLQPTTELNQSQGRFVALRREFLDPATIPAGTFLTITGEVAGSITLPLDEMEYAYPIVELKTMKVWVRVEDQPVRIRPHMGPGPYWGPYWSPYWRPWPYW